MNIGEITKSHFVTTMSDKPLFMSRYQKLDKNDTMAEYMTISPSDSARNVEYFTNAEIFPLPADGPNVFGVYASDGVTVTKYKAWVPLNLA